MSRILRGLTIPLLAAVVFGLMAETGTAAVTLPNTHHWGEVSPWAQVYEGSSLDGSQSAPVGSTSLKFTYRKGLYNGNAPDKVWVGFPEQNELWTQYYFKYSGNFYFHPVDNKQTYWYISKSSLSTNWYITCSANRKMRMVYQRSPGSGSRYPNASYNPTIERDVWYQVTTRAILNTGGLANGVFQMWINGQLVMNHSDVPYLTGADIGKKVGSMAFDPVFGGMGGEYKPADDYFFVGTVTISTDPLVSSPPPVTVPPQATNEIKIPQIPSSVTIH